MKLIQPRASAESVVIFVRATATDGERYYIMYVTPRAT